MTAVMVRIDHIQEGVTRILFFDLCAPIQGLLWNQRSIDEHNTIDSVDKAGCATAIVGVDKNTGRQFFAFTQAGDADADCATSSCH
jgi:hypothetical protein